MSEAWGNATRKELWKIIQEQGAELKRLNDEGTAPENERLRALEADAKRLKASLEDAEKEERKADEHREKAEAEVERLTKAIENHSCYCAICGPNSAHFAIDILGGGRERESDVRERSTEVGERTTVPERARKDTAANRGEAIPPAKPADSGGRPCCGTDPEANKVRRECDKSRSSIADVSPTSSTRAMRGTKVPKETAKSADTTVTATESIGEAIPPAKPAAPCSNCGYPISSGMHSVMCDEAEPSDPASPQDAKPAAPLEPCEECPRQDASIDWPTGLILCPACKGKPASPPAKPAARHKIWKYWCTECGEVVAPSESHLPCPGCKPALSAKEGE